MSTPRVPPVGDDPRERAQIDEPAGKTWFRDLDEAVIEADRCIQCGTCIAACPSDSIGVDEIEQRPTLVAMCTGCSRCWDFCPRSGLRYERLLEDTASDPAVYAARAVRSADGDRAQDGGAVTALLASLLETGDIDGAVVARERSGSSLEGEAFLATTVADLRTAAGSCYNQTMQLGHLDTLLSDAGLENGSVALVGTPCVIQGVSALERHQWDGEVAAIDLTVALMCTRSFEYPRLRRLLEDHGVDVENCAKLDVSGGVLYAYDRDGESVLEAPVESFDEGALRGCAECADLVGGTADISAGSIGSPDGYTTVIVRTPRGERAWEQAADQLERRPLEGGEALDRVDRWNAARAREVMPRSYDPDGSLGISYSAHRAAYDGTDRAPQPLNPARVHQYERWC